MAEMTENPNQTLQSPWPEPFIPTIVLNDGTTLNGSGSTTIDEVDLWLWIDEDMTYARASELFENNPSLTSRITVHASKLNVKNYERYTVLSDIQKQPTGQMAIRLNRPTIVADGGD